MRVGIGYDVHRLVKGRELVLGGIKIPYKKGLLGHSDADVLVHAICDAFLGALGCGDIGEHFPDTDKRFKDISSIKLLKDVFLMIKKKGYKINNIDTIVVADKPKISSYKNRIRKNIANVLKITTNKINIKATTEEKTKKIESIASYAICLIEKDKKSEARNPKS
jgi:2-C-methyl-D-erythritol 2,4-cyclodiphosphate synthase